MKPEHMALWAKLDNARRRNLPFAANETVVYGTTITEIEDGNGNPVAEAERFGGDSYVNFDSDYAELIVAAVNIVPDLLEYTESLEKNLRESRIETESMIHKYADEIDRLTKRVTLLEESLDNTCETCDGACPHRRLENE